MDKLVPETEGFLKAIGVRDKREQCISEMIGGVALVSLSRKREQKDWLFVSLYVYSSN